MIRTIRWAIFDALNWWNQTAIRWLDRNIFRWRDDVSAFSAVVDACSEDNPNIEKVFRLWEKAFSRWLRLMGFGIRSRKALFGWGRDGFPQALFIGLSGTENTLQSFRLWGHNWEKLHPTETEKEMSFEERLDDFSSNVCYASDRMSLDRLFRCHWRFGHAMRAYVERNTELSEEED